MKGEFRKTMDVDDGCSKFVGGKFGDDFDPGAINITITNITVAQKLTRTWLAVIAKMLCKF